MINKKNNIHFVRHTMMRNKFLCVFVTGHYHPCHFIHDIQCACVFFICVCVCYSPQILCLCVFWAGHSVTCESLGFRELFCNFTSRSRSLGILISLSLLEKSETKNHFTFHFSKRVKAFLISLFFLEKKE